jgi:hypothetical protein
LIATITVLTDIRAAPMAGESKSPALYTTWKVIGYSIDPLKNISLLNQLLAKKTLKGSSANFWVCPTYPGARVTLVD